MSDIDRLKKLPGYLGAGKFRQPPQIGDMDGFSLDQNDIEDLKKCKPGSCKLQLTEESIEAVRNSMDWTSPELVQQINLRAERGLSRFWRLTNGTEVARFTSRIAIICCMQHCVSQAASLPHRPDSIRQKVIATRSSHYMFSTA